MTEEKQKSIPWDRYTRYLCAPRGLGVAVDPSHMEFDDAFLASMEGPIEKAFDAMEALEAGVIANPDETRHVGHYWLREPDIVAGLDDPQLRPLAGEIRKTLARVESFAGKVLSGEIRPPQSGRFENLLLVGIGGSALGPQLVADALVDLPGKKRPGLRSFFLDNTDPDGIARTLEQIEGDTRGGLAATLVLVVSKSGSTPETRNGMLEVEEAMRRRRLTFAQQAVAITMEDSELDHRARDSIESWIDVFPMWEWVGGRTSETSAVGLLPAALAGVDIRALLAGARDMDRATRSRRTLQNPAAVLALSWFLAGDGRGSKQMVVLPYKDRLVLFSRYLQQLVMESLGKRFDLDDNEVFQGLTVYGNKGSTDQHAYIQQLRDGRPDFFVSFVQVLDDGVESPLEVKKGVTSGDYLAGFLLGTRQALHEEGRGSVTITLDRVDAEHLGKLIALFERAVGLYAYLININAYHQPGVEAGKKAAEKVLALQGKALTSLRDAGGACRSAPEIAASIGEPDRAETVYQILRHRGANPSWGHVRVQEGERPTDARFGWQ